MRRPPWIEVETSVEVCTAVGQGACTRQIVAAEHSTVHNIHCSHIVHRSAASGFPDPRCAVATQDPAELPRWALSVQCATEDGPHLWRIQRGPLTACHMAAAGHAHMLVQCSIAERAQTSVT